jgi:predicted transcriptional regulator
MKSTSLGKLEQQIMDIVWQSKECSARDVLTRLEKRKNLFIQLLQQSCKGFVTKAY